MELRPHDLLRIRTQTAAGVAHGAARAGMENGLGVYRGMGLTHDGVAPAWVEEALATPWVVVRRDLRRGDRVPVGVRGRQRNQRFAAYLEKSTIAAVVTPEQLAAQAAWKSHARQLEVEAFSALDVLANRYRSLDLTWGPTGSLGFELASGAPAAVQTSDVDLVIRAPRAWNKDEARSLQEFHQNFTVRIDVQLETPNGAVSLAEYAREEGPILLRTSEGPRLVTDPWLTDPVRGSWSQFVVRGPMVGTQPLCKET
ncbi:malonate decarboxylase holo-ACP synthase [Alicyclobacillus tolerans]|uniref:malonate decarboxylase holo-ACP synthase n=1 Tax=Alicyclobacillus tolerans TaxID=90970 RepID=UPI001F02575D|nr:malonate decarboxylase holo-ACP synthase [Alicyclobacillus tolerans]MCF8563211.1 malonate decarboxylase holo-ACP synthase [Alicyclobacillus tolerans]